MYDTTIYLYDSTRAIKSVFLSTSSGVITITYFMIYGRLESEGPVNHIVQPTNLDEIKNHLRTSCNKSHERNFEDVALR